MSLGDLWLYQVSLNRIIYLNTSWSLPLISEPGFLTCFFSLFDFLNFGMRYCSHSALPWYFLSCRDFSLSVHHFYPSFFSVIITLSIYIVLFFLKVLHKLMEV